MLSNTRPFSQESKQRFSPSSLPSLEFSCFLLKRWEEGDSPIQSLRAWNIAPAQKANHKAEDSAIKKAFSIFSLTLLLSPTLLPSLPPPPSHSSCFRIAHQMPPHSRLNFCQSYFKIPPNPMILGFIAPQSRKIS